jgi:type II secretory pathway component PulF
MNKKAPINRILKFQFGMKQRISLYKKLKSFTEEEFAIYDSLIKFKTRFDKKKDFRGKIIGIWLENLKDGKSLSYAISGWVPDSELNLIAAGEDGQGIEYGLGEAIRFAESSQKIKNTIISGASYPALLFVAVIGFIAMFSIKLAPTYLTILPLEKWPDLGRNFYAFSKFIVDYWYVALGLLIAFGVVIGLTISKWVGRIRRVFDNLPPWSIYKVYQGSAFLIMLASLMKSGTPLNDALKKIKKISSPWVSSYLEQMLRNLKKGGKNFGQHLHVGLLDEETAYDVIDYSELGKFEEAVYTIGDNNLNESIVKIEKKTAMVKSLMIMLVGVTVGIIYYTTMTLNSTAAEAASSGTNSSASQPK